MRMLSILLRSFEKYSMRRKMITIIDPRNKATRSKISKRILLMLKFKSKQIKIIKLMIAMREKEKSNW
jgi:hypothetical protein